MKNYTLELVSGTSYKLYDGAALVSDADLATLFGTAGSAYFIFSFDGSTPSSTNAIQIINSTDLVVIENTGLADTISEGKTYKGTWSASATSFDTFVELSGKSLDEAQLSFLMGKIKANAAEFDDVAYINSIIGSPTNVAYVGTDNIQAGAVTKSKIDSASYSIYSLPTHTTETNEYSLDREGGVVVLNVSQIWTDSGLTANTWTTVGNITAEIAPSSEVRGLCGIVDSTGVMTSTALWRVTSTGNLAVNPMSSTTGLTGIAGCSLTWVI